MGRETEYRGKTTFEEAKRRGKIGTYLSQDFLLSLDSPTLRSECREATHTEDWELKVDLRWTFQRLPDGDETSRWVEVKRDRRRNTSHRFIIETCSNELQNSPGWLQRTQADYLHFVIDEDKSIYSTPMPVFREWFQTEMTQQPFVMRNGKEVERFPLETRRTPLKNRTGFYVSLFRLIALDDVQQGLGSHFRKHYVPDLFDKWWAEERKLDTADKTVW